MTTYSLTVLSAAKVGRDVQVIECDGLMHAIELAEAATGCRVDHGRGGENETAFQPAIIINARTGDVDVIHNNPASVSMTRADIPRGFDRNWKTATA